MIVVKITEKNGPGSRRPSWTRRVECSDLDHARNLARKVVAPNVQKVGYKTKNINPVTKVVVFVSDTERAVWTKGTGWTKTEVEA